VSRQRTALSVAYRSSRGQISGSVCIGYIGIRAGTPNRSDSARSVGLGIKYNSGLPMRHSESALVSASASTSPWPKPYSDWPRCCADSASRQLPLFLPRSTRGYLFGQKKVSNSVCNSGTVECPSPIQKVRMPRRIGAGPLFHAQAVATEGVAYTDHAVGRQGLTRRQIATRDGS
jgi:hypothetical protein